MANISPGDPIVITNALVVMLFHGEKRQIHLESTPQTEIYTSNNIKAKFQNVHEVNQVFHDLRANLQQWIKIYNAHSSVGGFHNDLREPIKPPFQTFEARYQIVNFLKLLPNRCSKQFIAHARIIAVRLGGFSEFDINCIAVASDSNTIIGNLTAVDRNIRCGRCDPSDVKLFIQDKCLLGKRNKTHDENNPSEDLINIVCLLLNDCLILAEDHSSNFVPQNDMTEFICEAFRYNPPKNSSCNGCQIIIIGKNTIRKQIDSTDRTIGYNLRSDTGDLAKMLI